MHRRVVAYYHNPFPNDLEKLFEKWFEKLILPVPLTTHAKSTFQIGSENTASSTVA
jgi:hypothetical protein